MSSDTVSPAGVCLIKPEFIVTDHERCLSKEHVSQKDLEKIEENTTETTSVDTNGSGSKKMKIQNNPKLTGQNKQRRKGDKSFWKENKEFCVDIIDNLDKENFASFCSKGDSCKYEHDPNKYLEKKLPDLGDECYVFKTLGHCSWGITCRFGKSHLNENGVNMVNESIFDKNKKTSKQCINVLDKEIIYQLWKKKYNFELSNKAVQEVETRAKKPTNNDAKNAQENDDEMLDLKTEGAIDDSDEIKLKNDEKKKLDWKGLLYLSPLTTVGNLPFRRICVEYGADITCSEMTLALPLLKGTREWTLVKRHHSEKIFGVQICGNNPLILTKTAQVLEENVSLDFLDINLGCPIDALYQQGCGSGMLARKGILVRSCSAISSVLKEIPLTVKLRTGLTSSSPIAHNLMPIFRASGVQLATVHGRSREQRYLKNADWSYINECAIAASPMPVFGNGDILSYQDYSSFLDTASNCSGAMIGRGALIKPWIFQEIKEKKHIDISSSERFDIVKKYVNYGLELWGSDSRGVETTRRFLLEWLSFLHRYVPVGLLERPPQLINQRPPVYKGRDDMETLMASSNCSDWVKISEMLLGKVPDGFVFLPKHKSNAWK